MKFVYVISFWMFLSEIKISTTEAISLHVSTGQYVIILCSHTFAQNNRKYFCRDPCNDRDVLVSSDQSPNGRFRLEDFRNGSFTVTISDLQESDSDIYWCGVDRVGIDTYHNVNLRVYKGETETHTASDLTTQTASVSPSTSKTSTFALLSTGLIKASVPPDAFTHNNTKAVSVSVRSVVYAVGGLVVTVTVFAVGLVCACRYKKRCVSTASTRTDNVYKNEESDSIYENERFNTTAQKLKNIEDIQSQEDSIYQNLHVNTSPAEVIYCNL